MPPYTASPAAFFGACVSFQDSLDEAERDGGDCARLGQSSMVEAKEGFDVVLPEFEPEPERLRMVIGELSSQPVVAGSGR